MNMRTVAGCLVALAFGVQAGWGASAIATMKGTAPNSPITGTIHLEDTPAGLRVQAQLVGVPAGKHGFHIHEFGSCDDMGKAAGGHYNPMSMPHGDVLKAGVMHAHPGDMGNLTAEANGNATLDVTIPGVSLTGDKYNVAGRALIVHEKVDDFSQPTGNAGNRIACGPILISSEKGMAAPAK